MCRPYDGKEGKYSVVDSMQKVGAGDEKANQAPVAPDRRRCRPFFTMPSR